MMTYVNSLCPNCKERFNASLKKIVVCYPCEHYYHENCANSNINKKCKHATCNKTLKLYKSKKDFEIDNQHKINLLALKRTSYKPSTMEIINAIFYRVPLITWHLMCFIFQKKSYFSLQKLLTNINNVLNIHIKLIGDENLNDLKKIYISNHSSFLDALIIPQCIISGAVASITQENNIFGKLMRKCTHVYFVERGKSNKSVEKIEHHIDKHGSLLFCPQGMFGHKDVLTSFRTGAFATKYNVQPVLALYKQNISSLSMFNILCYPRVDVTIKILPELTKKTDESVGEFTERSRKYMACEGNLLLSNVSSRDITD